MPGSPNQTQAILLLDLLVLCVSQVSACWEGTHGCVSGHGDVLPHPMFRKTWQPMNTEPHNTDGTRLYLSSVMLYILRQGKCSHPVESNTRRPCGVDTGTCSLSHPAETFLRFSFSWFPGVGPRFSPGPRSQGRPTQRRTAALPAAARFAPHPAAAGRGASALGPGAPPDPPAGPGPRLGRAARRERAARFTAAENLPRPARGSRTAAGQAAGR